MRSTFFSFLLLLLLNALPAISFSAEGDPDLTFAVAGIATTAVGSLDEKAYDMALQADGKILLTGYSNNGSDNDIALLRYNSDGSLDTSFNSTGIVTTDVALLNDAAYSVAVQPDGKILVAGNSVVNYHSRVALLRYTEAGELDNGFGLNGVVTTDVGLAHDYAQSIVLQPDGKILVGGYSDNGSNNDMALLRYNSDGSLDTGFNSTGIVTLDIGGANDIARSLALQPDGRILLAGYSTISGNNDVALARFNSDGSLDTSFNSTGYVTTNVGSGDNAYSVAIQPEPSGKILVGGYSYLGNYSQITLLRYNSDGSLDTSFNATGIVTTDINGYYDYALSLALQRDSKILVGGYSDNGSKNDMALLRYTTDGHLDTSFNGTGIVTTDVGGLNDGAYCVKVQDDGNILLAGYSNIGGNYDFALLRYEGTPVTEHTVTPIAGPNGGIDPNEPQLVLLGDWLSFTVTPDPGYQVDSVTGCGGTLVGDIYTTGLITADCTVSATFAPVTHTLSVSVTGLGTVHSSPGIDIACTADCSQDYLAGELVTLTASPALDYSLAEWTGDCSGAGNCLLTMDTSHSATANFLENVPNPVMLEGSQNSYLSMQSAYDSIPSGQSDTIMVKAGEQIPETLSLDRDVTITIAGGYDEIFRNVTSGTSFSGSLTLSGGPVTIANLTIK